VTAAEPVALLARALDPSTAPPADATSERILDAAVALIAASGTRHLTMEDVARRARVGRMTVYRRFGDKLGLLEALAVREVRRCLAVLGEAIRPEDPVADQVVGGFVTSVRLLHEHPVLSRLARVEPHAVLESLIMDDAAIFSFARAFAADRLRAAQAAGTVAADLDADQAAELAVRLMLSFALIGDTVLPLDDEERARQTARRLLTPLFEALAP
jgi:TetR/AcrR family transcriptional regulator, repressor for uid operon